ncbi:hypothetical protein P7C70_g3079, partial [Phenoliferia sp. Uapishka_3]
MSCCGALPSSAYLLATQSTSVRSDDMADARWSEPDPHGAEEHGGAHLLPPPSYHASLATPHTPAFPAFQGTIRVNTPFEHSLQHLNLPAGYFLLRNKSTRQRTFDVRGRGTADGNEICLHPVKQPYVPRGASGWQSLQNGWNNQVLYIDWNGTLMTASADGRAIDCVDGDLLLAVPRPLFAIPSRDSHPLPQFHLDPSTSTLHVTFSYDPSFPGPDSTSTEWMTYDYIVESVPSKRKKEDPSVWATASSGLLSGIEKLGLFSRSPNPASGSGFMNANGREVEQSHQDDQLLSTPPRPVPKPVGPWDTSRSPGSQTIFEQQRTPPTAPSHNSAPALLPYVPYRPSHPNSPLPALPSSSASTSFFPPQSTSPSRPTHLPSARSSPPSPRLPPPEDSDSDSDQDAYRPLRVIRLAPSWREKFPRELLAGSGPLPNVGIESSRAKEIRKWKRRQWDAVPIVVKPVETREGAGPILPLLPRTGILSGNFGVRENDRDSYPGERSREERERRERERPSPLNLRGSPESQRMRERIVSPPLPRVPLDMEGDDGRSFATPSTGDSWADATILASAAIAGLVLPREADDSNSSDLLARAPPQPTSKYIASPYAPAYISPIPVEHAAVPEPATSTPPEVSQQEHALSSLPAVPTGYLLGSSSKAKLPEDLVEEAKEDGRKEGVSEPLEG